jgi:hypothetical protein
LVGVLLLAGCGPRAGQGSSSPSSETVIDGQASSSNIISVEEMKLDLMGKAIRTEGRPPWQFESPSEFENFEILVEEVQGNVLKYTVFTNLRANKRGDWSYTDGSLWTANMTVIYKKVGDQWMIAFVEGVFDKTEAL